MKRLLYLCLTLAILSIAFTGLSYDAAQASTTDCCESTVGDVNLDGLVNGGDDMLLRSWMNCEDVNICMDAADWNGDGYVDWLDVYALGGWTDDGSGSPPGDCHSYDDCNIVINTQPVDTVVVVGETLNFGIDVSSDCAMHFRWYHNGTLRSCDSMLFLGEIEPSDGGEWWVEILTVNGRLVTDTFLVTVLSVTFDPPSMDLCYPSSGTVGISVDINPPGSVPSVTVDVATTNSSVATFTGDQTGGTVNTVGTGRCEITATYNGRIIGIMPVLAATFLLDVGTPEYLQLRRETPQEAYVTSTPDLAEYTLSNSDESVVLAENLGWIIELTPVNVGTAIIDLKPGYIGEDICASFTVEVIDLYMSSDTVYFCNGSDDKVVNVSVSPSDLNWSITSTVPGVATAVANYDNKTIEVSALSGGYTTVRLFGGVGGAIQAGSFVVLVSDWGAGIDPTAQHVSMSMGSGSQTVGLDITPADADWWIEVSDPTIVSAVQIGDDVVITPLAPGYAQIDLYAEGFDDHPCGDFTVSVFDISVSGPVEDTVCMDSIFYHTVSILPAADFDSVTVTSSNPNVVTASLFSATSVEMFGVSEGTATINLIYDGEICGSYEVVVEDCITCLDVGNMKICADALESLGSDNYRLTGNVTIDSVLWFDQAVVINTLTGALTGDGKIEIKDISGAPNPLTLWDGPISATIVGDTLSDLANPMVAFAVGMLGIKIDEIVLISGGIHINGSVVLPTILGVDAAINTLELTTGDGVQIAGRIYYEGPLGVKGLQIKDIWLEFDTPNETFAAGAMLEIKKVVTIGGSVEIVSGALNSISMEVKLGYPIPIGTTGLRLAGGAGEVDHMADAEPILIGLTVDITGGPRVAGVDMILFDDVGVTIQPPLYFGVSGAFKVFDIPVAQAKAYYQPPKFGLAFNRSFYGGVINGGFTASLTGTQFAGSARATIGTPCDLPWYLAFMRCKKFGGAAVSVANTSMMGRVWVRIPYRILWKTRYISMEGAFKLAYMGDNDYDFYVGKNYNAMAKIFKKTNKDGQYLEGFEIAEHTESVMFMVKSESGNVPDFHLIKPDLSVCYDLDSIGIVRMPDSLVAFVIVQNPEAGRWTMEIPDYNGVDSIIVMGQNTRPSIAFVDPAGDETNGYIQWHDHDPDDDAKISLYFDNDNRDFDGILINDTPISENSEIDQYTWDMTIADEFGVDVDVDPGDYYIYGVIEDTVNAPYRIYAPGKITIPNTLGPGAPSALVPTTTDISVILNWTPSPDLVLGYEVVFTDDLTSTRYNDHWTVGDTNDIEITSMITGREYRMAIRCFDSLNNVSNFSDPIYVTIVSSNNNPPVISRAGLNTTAQEDQPYIYAPTISDVDPSDVLTVVLDSVPDGFTWLSGTGEFEWTPVDSQVGVHWIQFRAVDGAGGEDTLGYLLHVVEADRSYGNVNWGAAIYGSVSEPGIIVLQDFDLDLSEYAIDSTEVHVSSDTDPVGVNVWVKQIQPMSEDFIGTIEFSLTGSDPGVIHVSDGDLVTVTYTDEFPEPEGEDDGEVVDVAKWVLRFDCCRTMAGNVDDDPNDMIDISDLVYLIDYMFQEGPQPGCPDEANIDGIGSGLSGIDISDLVYLIDYMWRNGPAPASCP